MSSNKINIRLGWTEHYMADEPKVCDSCIAAVVNEGGYEEGAEATMAVDTGGDIDDHTCELTVQLYPCACSCRVSLD